MSDRPAGRRTNGVRSRIVWAVGDLLIIWLAFLLAHAVRHFKDAEPGVWSPDAQGSRVLVGIGLAWVGLFAVGGLYRREMLSRGLDQLLALFRWVSFGVLLALLAAFGLRSHYLLEGRFVLFLAWVLCLAGLGLYRFGVVRTYHERRARRRSEPLRVLVVGAGQGGRDFVARVREDGARPLTPVGFLDDDPAKIGHAVAGLQVLASTGMVELIAREEQVDEIVVAIPSLSPSETVSLVSRCMRAGVPVKLVSDSFHLLTSTTEVEIVGGVPTVHLRQSNLSGAWPNVVKRTTDLLGAGSLLLLLAPLFGLIALLIRVFSGSPVIFRQARAGRHGRPFTLYKFRTMREAADEDLHRRYAAALITGEDLALEDAGSRDRVYKPPTDPRVTRVGRLLRRTSLDELPQFVNVLRGEMSLVGPRPPILYELNHYQEWHRRRFAVKPGVTGLWQVHGRSRVPFDGMVTLDLYYIDHWSLLTDLKLLVRTIPVVLSGKGAY